MEDAESLIKIALAEIEKLLTAKAVVCEPMTVEGNTIIPLVSIGFGFGGGGGKGTAAKEKGEGAGAGTGGAGSVKPVGVIVVNKEGVRIETLKGVVSSLAESIANIVGGVMAKRGEKKEEKKEG